MFGSQRQTIAPGELPQDLAHSYAPTKAGPSPLTNRESGVYDYIGRVRRVGLELIPAIVVFMLAGILVPMPFPPPSWMKPELLVALFVGVCALLVLLFESLSVLNKFPPTVGVRITMDSNGFSYIDRHDERRIHFADILKLEFSYIKYIGGWVTVISDSTDFSFWLGLENADDLLLKLKDHLDQRGLSARYEAREYSDVLQTATAGEQACERLFGFVAIFPVFMIAAGAIAYMFAVVAGVEGMGRSLWVILAFYWPYLVWGGSEIPMTRRFARLADERPFYCPPRDLAFEKSVAQSAVVWGALGFLVICSGVLLII